MWKVSKDKDNAERRLWGPQTYDCSYTYNL